MTHSICINAQNAIIVQLGEIKGDASLIRESLDMGKFKKSNGCYVYSDSDAVKFDRKISWITDFFTKQFGQENVEICEAAVKRIQSIRQDRDLFEKSKADGMAIKQQSTHEPDLPIRFKRKLMDYQKMSVEHIIRVGNAANFSAPGSGKTTITYAAISKWIEDGTIEKILVIGPTASFLPWEEEYEECFGKKPRAKRISGDVSSILDEIGSSYDMLLMHFNTAMNRVENLKRFMEQWNTALIIDESHYIKNPDLRRWGSMAISIAPYAKRRIVLSGTPMPNNAKDLWTQITFLWPHDFPLGKRENYTRYAQLHGIGNHAEVLNSLFCRIKKSDLNLPIPEFIPETVPLGSYQRRIYDAIAAKTLAELEEMSILDQSHLQKLRMAKMIRLLQTASNPTLLGQFSSTFDVDGDKFQEAYGLPPSIGPQSLPNVDSSIIEVIKNYTDYEVPSKITRTKKLAHDLVNEGNKVIIWSTFIHNMTVLQDVLGDLDPIVINGTVPTEGDGLETRDVLINRFKNDSNMVLVASPASLAESVSLHKNLRGENVCSHAIYLDRNFSGAQYMQSMDRIHRIGMDTATKVKYHLLIAKDTIDEVINCRLNEKYADMLTALNDDMLQSLDIDPIPKRIDDKEFEMYYRDMIAHLRKMYGA